MEGFVLLNGSGLRWDLGLAGDLTGEGRAREKGFAGLGKDREAASDSEQGQAKNAVSVFCR